MTDPHLTDPGLKPKTEFRTHHIVLEDSAKKYMDERGLKEITVDLESFGGCVAVTEAKVLDGPPTDRPTTFLKYEVDGYTVYVYSLARFLRDTVTVYKRKGIFAKKGLEAKEVYQV